MGWLLRFGRPKPEPTPPATRPISEIPTIPAGPSIEVPPPRPPVPVPPASVPTPKPVPTPVEPSIGVGPPHWQTANTLCYQKNLGDHVEVDVTASLRTWPHDHQLKPNDQYPTEFLEFEHGADPTTATPLRSEVLGAEFLTTRSWLVYRVTGAPGASQQPQCSGPSSTPLLRRDYYARHVLPNGVRGPLTPVQTLTFVHPGPGTTVMGEAITKAEPDVSVPSLMVSGAYHPRAYDPYLTRQGFEPLVPLPAGDPLTVQRGIVEWAEVNGYVVQFRGDSYRIMDPRELTDYKAYVVNAKALLEQGISGDEIISGYGYPPEIVEQAGG